MLSIFDFDRVEFAKSLVKDYVVAELYPTDTPDFQVLTLSFSGLTVDEDWRGYFSTDLPDDMLFEVIHIRDEPKPQLTAYKKEEI